MLNSIRNIKFIKIAKARNAYHRCLCSLIDQTTIAQLMKFLPDSLLFVPWSERIVLRYFPFPWVNLSAPVMRYEMTRVHVRMFISLTSKQTREKLQYLYENLMSNNFRKTAVLKKYEL